MLFFQSILTNPIISCEFVLNRVFNFAEYIISRESQTGYIILCESVQVINGKLFVLQIYKGNDYIT